MSEPLVCEECGKPWALCICDHGACWKCGVVGCLGECDDEEDDVDPLNFDDDGQ